MAEIIDGDGHTVELEAYHMLYRPLNIKKADLASDDEYWNKKFVRLEDVVKLLEDYTHNDEVPNCDDCEERRLDERPGP